MDLIMLVGVEASRAEYDVRLELTQAREDFFSEVLAPVLRSHLADSDRHVEDSAGVDFIRLLRVLDYISSAWVEKLKVGVDRSTAIAAVAVVVVVKEMH
jgi:hypothetical protein